MLASLIRLRQSQSANKGSNCDRGDMREVNNYYCAEEILPFFLFFLIPPAHKYKLIYMHAFTYMQIGTYSHMLMHMHPHTRTQTGHRSKSKSNCHESHCHRGNSGQLYAEHILSYLWWVFFFLYAPHTHTDAANFQLQ